MTFTVELTPIELLEVASALLTEAADLRRIAASPSVSADGAAALQARATRAAALAERLDALWTATRSEP